MSSFSDLVKKANSSTTSVKRTNAVEEEKKQASSFSDLITQAYDGSHTTTKLSSDQIFSWSSGVLDLSRRVSSYLTADGYKTPDASLRKEIDTYLSQANDVAQYVRANKTNYEDYDSIYNDLYARINALRSMQTSLNESDRYYSSFSSEDEYFWSAAENREKRQQRYAENQKAIENLKVERNQSTTTSARKTEIDAEIAKIETEMRNYERGNGYFSNKTVDDYYLNYTGKTDFESVSAYRNFTNPTMEDLQREDVMNDSTQWYWGTDSKQYDAFGNEIVKGYDSDGNAIWVSSGLSGNKIIDRLGFYLNASETELNDAAATDANHEGTATSVLKDGIHGNWELLKDTEVDIYYYLLNSEGQEAADQYLDSMTTELNKRATMDSTKRLVQTYENANWAERTLLNVASVGAQLYSNIAGGIDYVGSAITGQELNPYSMAYAGKHFSDTVRGETAKNWDEATGSFETPILGFSAGDLYQTGMSLADSYTAMGLGGGLGGVLLGMGAGTSEAIRLYEEGASDSQIAWGGMLAGAAEMVLETVSIGELRAIKNADDVTRVIKHALIQGGVEASEEGFTELANTIANAIIMGSESDWAKLIEENNGNVLQAVLYKLRDIGAASLGGFLSGAAGGGGIASIYSTANKIAENDAAKAMYGGNPTALIDQALEINPDNKYAQKMQSRANDGKSISGTQLAKLVRQNEAGMVQNDTAAIKKATADRLTDLGETTDIEAVSSALAKQAAGEKLTKAEQQTISNSKYGQRVANELNAENIQSGQYTSDWAQKIGTERINADEYNRLVKDAKINPDAAEAAEGNSVIDVENEAQTAKTKTTEPDNANTQAPANVMADNVADIDEDQSEKSTITLESASKAFGAQSGAYVATYNLSSGQDVAKFDDAYRKAYEWGQSDAVPLDVAITSSLTSYLTKAQREAAYLAGRDAKNALTKNREDNIKKRKSGKTARRKGTIQGKGVSIADLKTVLNDQQGKAYGILAQIAEVTGIDIVLYQSRSNTDGKYTDDQGYFKWSDDKIYIDINAGLRDRGDVGQAANYTMLRTFNHEFTHFLEKHNPAEYNELRQAVFDVLREHGEDVDALILQKQGEDENGNPLMSYDAASREVVAEALTDILPDANFVEVLAQRHKNVFELLLDKLKEFVESIREYFAELTPNKDKGANALKEEVDGALHYMESIVALFDKVAVHAVENYQASVAVDESADVGKNDANARKTHENTSEQTTDTTLDKRAISYFKARSNVFVIEYDGQKYLSDSAVMVKVTDADIRHANEEFEVTENSLPDSNKAILNNADTLIVAPPTEAQLPNHKSIYIFDVGDQQLFFDKKLLSLLDGGLLYYGMIGEDTGIIKSVNEDGSIRGYLLGMKIHKKSQIINEKPSKLRSFSKKMQALIQSKSATNNNDGNITQAQPRPHSDEIGDDNHGSTDTELLEGREISASDRGGNGLRKQSKNTRTLLIQLAYAHNGKAVPFERLRAGESGWTTQSHNRSTETRWTGSHERFLRSLSRITLSETDSVGRVLPDNALKKFNDTVLKDADGKILSMYHWTDTAFDVFAKGDIGFHFGTLKSAHDRRLVHQENVHNSSGIYKEVYLNLTNPLLMYDIEAWSAYDVAYQLIVENKISEEELAYIQSLAGFYDEDYHAQASVELRKLLQSKGYDGFLYMNKSEDEGSISAAVFNANQIITVAENGILKEGTGITEPSSNEGLVQSQSREYLNSSKNAKHKKYSYEWFTNKPDMAITTLDSQAPSTRADIIKQAKKNAAIIGTTNNDGSVSVHVYDNGADVLLGTDGLKHGLRRSAGIESDINSTVALKAGEIIQNSIQINEITPSKEDASKSYVLIGAARGTNGEDYIVRFVVNQFNNELASIDVLYAIKTKKELAALNAPRFTAKPLSVTSSTISIAKLLENVNDNFSDVLPEDLLKHFGHTERPDGDLSKDVLYQSRTQTLSDREILEMAADELTLDDLNQAELSALNIFRSRLDKLRHLQQQWDKQQEAYLQNRHSDKGAATKAKNRMNVLASQIEQANNDILDIENKSVLRGILQKARTVVEKQERTRGDEKIKRIRERRNNATQIRDYRERIRRTIRSLDKLLNKSNKKQNVKTDMQEFVSKALQSARTLQVTKPLQAAEALFIDNYTDEDMIRNGVGTELTEKESKQLDAAKQILADIDSLRNTLSNAPNATAMLPIQNRLEELTKKLDYRRSQLRDVFARERSRLNSVPASQILGDLAKEYGKLQESKENYIADAYSENVHKFLLNLSSHLDTRVVRDMTAAELAELYSAYTMVLTTVRNANKAFLDERKESITQLATNVMSEVTLAKGSIAHYDLTKAVKSFSWNNLTPFTAFDRIGSSTLSRLYANVANQGQNTWAVDTETDDQFRLATEKKYNMNKWDFDKPHKFVSSTGEEFSLYLSQIMSIYAYSRREAAHDHLINGGFVFAKNAKDIAKKGIVKWEKLKGDVTAYKLSAELIAEIISDTNITKEQKAFVDEMQNYLSTTVGARGNEVSLALYGVKLFGEKHYFPLRSASDYMAKAKEADMKKSDGYTSIVNSAFTNALTPHASNPIILDDFRYVWAEHVADMAKYHAFALGLEDFRRVINYATPNISEEQSHSVMASIASKHGDSATQYIHQLYRDMNGDIMTDPRERIGMKAVSRFKKASVVASLSVVVQQYTAMLRAMAHVNPKYFVRVPVKGNKTLWNEMRTYAPGVTIIKDMGGFDTGTAQSAIDRLTTRQYGKQWLKGLATDKQYLSKKFDDVLGYLPALMDRIAWIDIWSAVKNETAANHPELKKGSEELLKLTGERFTEIINKTQVYDSVFVKSANMRSKSALMAMTTSFMSEPITTLNMVLDAHYNHKRMGATLGAIAISIIANNFCRSLIYAMRDDDEDETFWEKYAQALVSGLVDDIFPHNYFPWVRDIWSLFLGYDAERTDLSIISEIIDSATGLVTEYADTDDMTEEEIQAHNEEITEGWLSLAESIFSVFGIPVKNVRREINAFINFFHTISEDVSGRETTINSWWDSVEEGFLDSIPLGWLPDSTSKRNKLYDAILKGDDTYVERLAGSYSSEDAYHAAIRQALRENDPRIKEAATARFNEDFTSYASIAKKMIAEGYFTQNDIVAAITAEVNAMSSDNDEDATKNLTGLYKAADFAAAAANGDWKDVSAIKTDMINTNKANGKTADEAYDSFKNSAKTACKDRYLIGDLTEDEAIQAMTSYLDMSQDEAYADVQYWKFTLQYSDIKVDDGWFDTYYEKIESSGIPIKTYMEYRTLLKGKTKRADILPIINSMPITSEQKDTLYYAEKLAESTIHETPWR